MCSDQGACVRGAPCDYRLHSATLRPASRARPHSRRGRRCGAAQSPALRQVLRFGRRCLQPRMRVRSQIPTIL